MSTCDWWVLVVISAVTLIIYALLLLTLYIMLSRKIVAASHSCSKQAGSSPAAQPQQPPTSSAGGEGVQRPVYAGSSDTSSETSEDSDSSPSCPQGRRSEENLNYTSLVFPGKGSGPGSTGDYENMKTGPDYINVDPKKRKVDFWSCSSPVASKSIEYTEVKL
ncbi:regulator of hemoglobinization and erythroid cell expansion protein [Phalacrocorax carbo]|uniref:regulator of hemoglobinization and erythroid cell expansion protein n=1 Tax=Phalacrocorax carbo TaxID=9209 RepID=UPI003119759A